jgi:hypothetical protein
MNKEETPSIIPLSGSITTTSMGGETITPTTSTETFDHLADYNLIGGLTMP